MATIDNSKIKTQLAKREEKPQGMGALIKSMEAQIRLALPKHLTNERFQRQALTLWNNNPSLQLVEPKSFLAAMMTAAQLGLDLTPTLGQAYIIPYKGKAQFQMGYKGLLDLAYRTGLFRRIEAREVYENDAFELAYGLEGTLRHKPLLQGDRGQVIGYYSLFELHNGGASFLYLSKDDALKHAQKYSEAFKAGRNTPWSTDFDEMAKKTAVKSLLKYAPLSTEFRSNVQQDETVKVELSENMTEVPAIVDAEVILTGTAIEPAQIEGEAPKDKLI